MRNSRELQGLLAFWKLCVSGRMQAPNREKKKCGSEMSCIFLLSTRERVWFWFVDSLGTHRMINYDQCLLQQSNILLSCGGFGSLYLDYAEIGSLVAWSCECSLLSSVDYSFGVLEHVLMLTCFLFPHRNRLQRSQGNPGGMFEELCRPIRAGPSRHRTDLCDARGNLGGQHARSAGVYVQR